MTRSSIISIVHNRNIDGDVRPGAAQSIRFNSVSKVYPTVDGEVTALAKVSFAVGAGEFVSVLGPSGCGKSTLMLLAAGLEGLTTGEISIGDSRVERPVTDVGIVFQDHALYDWRTIPRQHHAAGRNSQAAGSADPEARA